MSVVAGEFESIVVESKVASSREAGDSPVHRSVSEDHRETRRRSKCPAEASEISSGRRNRRIARSRSFLFRSVSDGFGFHIRPDQPQTQHGDSSGNNVLDQPSKRDGLGSTSRPFSFNPSITEERENSDVADSDDIQSVLSNPTRLLEKQMKLAELIVSSIHADSTEPHRFGHKRALSTRFSEQRQRSTKFESFFDLTRPRLKYIFNILDRLSTQKSRGIVDYQNVREGLRDAGIEVRDQDSFRELLSAIDMDLDGGITFNEFEVVVQSLKMAALFKANYGHYFNLLSKSKESFEDAGHNFECFNYNASHCEQVLIGPGNVKDFMYKPRDGHYPNRWIKVQLPNAFVMKALSVKYRLHPLSLEDVLVSDPSSRAKVDVYENHYLITLPIITVAVYEHSGDSTIRPVGYGTFGTNSVLSREPSVFSRRNSFNPVNRFGDPGAHSGSPSFRRGMPWWRRWLPWSRSGSATERPLSGDREYVELEDENRSPPVIEAETLVDDDYIVPVGYSVPKLKKVNAFVVMLRPELTTVITAVPKLEETITEVRGGFVKMSPKNGDIFETTARELNYSYSKLRSSNCFYVMYSLVDAVVDSYFPIVTELDICLQKIRQSVRTYHRRRSSRRQHINFSRLYHELIGELAQLQRWLIPLQRVLGHFTKERSQNTLAENEEQDAIDDECRIHLADVLDNLNQLLDDIQGIIEGAKQVKEEHRQAVDTNMTKTMTGLTIIATIFLVCLYFLRCKVIVSCL